MRMLHFMLILCIVAVSSITITRIVYNLTSINDVVEMDIYATITENIKVIGVDISTEALQFSNVARGGHSSRRYINISADLDSFVVMEASGKVKDYVHTSDNRFILRAGESREIEVRLTPPEETPLGPTSGKLTAIFYKIR